MEKIFIQFLAINEWTILWFQSIKQNRVMIEIYSLPRISASKPNAGPNAKNI